MSFKPTSTIALTQQSVCKDFTEIDFELRKGRHDPCLGVRAGVTLESRLAIELLNGVLARQAKTIDPDQFKLFKELYEPDFRFLTGWSPPLAGR